jgi:transcriptional regulator with XRE-family HTH domain
MKKLPRLVAKNIKKHLNNRSKSAEKLAYEIGMSKSFIYEFLRGEKDMTIHNLQLIADGLEIKAKDLLEE